MTRGILSGYSVTSGEAQGLQQMQRTMHLIVEGPTIEKLVEKVQQAVTQSVAEVTVMQVELGGLRSKIVMPAE